MEWRPRTKTRSGQYQRVILDEAPPRIIVQGNEGYDELLLMGKNRFWTEEEAEGCEFTLCNTDGTTWTKEEFNLEFKDISSMSHVWKRTIFVGRREMGN